MSAAAAAENVIINFRPRQLSEFSDIFIDADIGQIRPEDSIDTNSLINGPVNKYYYAKTHDGQLFIVYITLKDEKDITYKKVYTRFDGLDPRNNDDIQAGIYTWIKYPTDLPIKISHGKLLRNNLKFYEIPIVQNDIEPPTFKYRGGKRKLRRTRRARRASRSRRLKRK